VSDLVLFACLDLAITVHDTNWNLKQDCSLRRGSNLFSTTHRPPLLHLGSAHMSPVPILTLATERIAGTVRTWSSSAASREPPPSSGFRWASTHFAGKKDHSYLPRPFRHPMSKEGSISTSHATAEEQRRGGMILVIACRSIEHKCTDRCCIRA
jgi:hypothetical protein